MKRMAIPRHAGFSLVEILVTAAATMVAFSIVVQAVVMHRREIKRIAFVAQLESMREAAVAAILSQKAWQYTRAGNSAMSCMTEFPATCGVPAPNAPPVDFNLYDATGKVIVNSTNPSSGFDESGKPCFGFSSSGSRSCPVRMRTAWNIVCNGADGCKYPEEYVSVLFEYSPPPGTGYVVNLNRIHLRSFSRVNLFDNQSPTVSCATKDMVFVGFGKTVLDGQRQPTSADADGCVPLQAFKGPRGFQGFMGPMGPQGFDGDPGPMGPPGNTIPPPPPLPPPPPPPQIAVCNSFPQICALYQKYFGRFPDAAGATFWSSQLAGGASLTAIEADFQLISVGGSHVTVGLNQTALWNSISASYGLPAGPPGDAACSGNVTCLQSNAAATAQYNTTVGNYCASSPGSCYINYSGVTP